MLHYLILRHHEFRYTTSLRFEYDEAHAQRCDLLRKHALLCEDSFVPMFRDEWVPRLNRRRMKLKGGLVFSLEYDARHESLAVTVVGKSPGPLLRVEADIYRKLMEFSRDEARMSQVALPSVRVKALTCGKKLKLLTPEERSSLDKFAADLEDGPETGTKSAGEQKLWNGNEESDEEVVDEMSPSKRVPGDASLDPTPQVTESCMTIFGQYNLTVDDITWVHESNTRELECFRDL